jgi:hypothetical protein
MLMPRKLVDRHEILRVWCGATFEYHQLHADHFPLESEQELVARPMLDLHGRHGIVTPYSLRADDASGAR